MKISTRNINKVLSAVGLVKGEIAWVGGKQILTPGFVVDVRTTTVVISWLSPLQVNGAKATATVNLDIAEAALSQVFSSVSRDAFGQVVVA